MHVQPEWRKHDASLGLFNTSEGCKQAPQVVEETQPPSFKSMIKEARVLVLIQ